MSVSSCDKMLAQTIGPCTASDLFAIFRSEMNRYAADRFALYPIEDREAFLARAEAHMRLVFQLAKEFAPTQVAETVAYLLARDVYAPQHQTIQ